MERHRKVISLVFNKMRETNIFKYPALIKESLKYVSSDIKLKDILSYSYSFFKIKNLNIEQLQIPTTKLSKGVILNKKKGWVILMDEKNNIKVLHEFIYEDKKYKSDEYNKFQEAY